MFDVQHLLFIWMNELSYNPAYWKLCLFMVIESMQFLINDLLLFLSNNYVVMQRYKLQ